MPSTFVRDSWKSQGNSITTFNRLCHYASIKPGMLGANPQFRGENIPKCGGLMSLIGSIFVFFPLAQSHFKQCGWTPVGWWNHQLKLNPSWLRHLWMDWSSWSLQSRIAPGALPSGCQQIQRGIVTKKFLDSWMPRTNSRPVSYDSYDFTLWLSVT